ncbi:MAG: cyclase family protein, partial [Solirubrobacteraceae bacterium]
MGAHTGTHVEAPLHTQPDGAPIDALTLDLLVGPARVLDLTGVESEITADDLRAAGLGDEERVLLRTTNSDGLLQGETIPETWVGLAPDGAELLVERGVRLVGVDFYTVEAPGRDKTFDSHYILSGAGISTVECVDLSRADAGVYELICLPVPIRGAEAAPARAVLRPLPSGQVPAPIDVTVPVHTGMLHWGRRPVREVVESFENGDRCNVTRWDIGSHTGTHTDAGRHFDDSKGTIDAYPLDVLIGRARVLDLTAVETEITAADLLAAGLAEGDERILLKTRNSTTALRETDKPDFWVGLAPDGAQLLADRGVRLVSIDFLTIDSPTRDETWDTHLVLCPADIAIVECLDLADVPAGEFELVCLPLRLRGAEAAPSPAFLRPLAA